MDTDRQKGVRSGRQSSIDGVRGEWLHEACTECKRPKRRNAGETHQCEIKHPNDISGNN